MELEYDGTWFMKMGDFHLGPLPNISPGFADSGYFRIKTLSPAIPSSTGQRSHHGGNSFGTGRPGFYAGWLAFNDAGGAPNSEADDAIIGDGPVNGTLAATDEDDVTCAHPC